MAEIPTAEEKRAALVNRIAHAMRDTREFVAGVAFGVPVDAHGQYAAALAEAALTALAEDGRLIDPTDLQGSVGVVVGLWHEAKAQLEQLRAGQYLPGPVAHPAPIGGGWAVSCRACEAPLMIGFASLEEAVARCAGHVHVYPDAEGFVPSGAWPKVRKS